MEDKVLRNLSYGMYLVGAKLDKSVGCIANTVVQITSTPKTIAISLNKDNYTTKIIEQTNTFSVSILDETTNQSLISTFGYKSSKDIDKYENIYPLTLDEANILNKHKDAVFIFMSPNDISKLENDLIKLKESE